MKRLLFCVGTRPEAIKILPLLGKFREKRKFECVLLSTGQHKELLTQVFNTFQIFPDISLDIMKDGQNLSHITSSCITNLQKIFEENEFDLTVVHGDTSTAFAASVSSFYNKVPIAHVEAGLRTHSLETPFPEEFNRRMIANIADLHFTPTTIASDNLRKEYVAENSIFVTGNTIVDSVKFLLELLRNDSGFRENLAQKFLWLQEYQSCKIILVTSHRRENFNDGIKNICKALLMSAERFADKAVFVFPVHLNPNIRKIVFEQLGGVKNIKIIEPLEYADFIYLQTLCDFIVTDSGGIQEEAACLHKPVLVMRDKTERLESVNSGIAKLVGNDIETICREVGELITNNELYRQMSSGNNPYGDGNANGRIHDAIINYFKQR